LEADVKSSVWTKLRIAYAVMVAVLFSAGAPAQVNERTEPPTIPADHFVKLHALIKPQPGELRFHEIPWLIDVWEARKKAAAEGKPILVWSGAGGSPVGVC
jgi:hypothetical protein